MIPHAQDDKFISHGIKSNNQFKLMNNSSIMDILSNRIYSDKFAAVLREIGCNAYDAHIAVGKKDVPFDVILPTVNDLRLIIRDYGSGLAPENVIELYTTYGFSSKTESNEYVGFMGIGSKSPFCYSSTFEVNSYFNGKKYSFLMFKDDDNIPNINHFATLDTDLPTGLEVIVPVSSYDVANFANKAKSIFEWFDTIPNIKNLPWGQKIVTAKDYNFINLNGLLVGKQDRYLSNSFVKMGNIVYALDKTQIPAFKKTRHFLNSVNFLLELNIGEVEVDSGREKLQYTKKVVAFLDERIKQITQRIKDNLKKSLDGITKIAILKKKTANFFFDISKVYDSSNGYGYSYSSISEFKHSISETFDIPVEYLSNQLSFNMTNCAALPTANKTQKNGKVVPLAEEKYPQNSAFKIGSRYYKGDYGVSLEIPYYNSINLLETNNYYFYTEGSQFALLLEYAKSKFTTADKNVFFLPSRVKKIFEDDYDISDEYMFDIDLSSVIKPKVVKRKQTLTFPVKVLTLLGRVEHIKAFTPADDTLYITIPVKYGIVETIKRNRSKLKETDIINRFLKSNLKNIDITKCLETYDKSLLTDKDKVLFLLINSKNKKQIVDGDSYLSLDKFLEIISLDDNNKSLYPILQDDDTLFIYNRFQGNSDLLNKIRSSYDIAKKIVPLNLDLNHPLNQILKNNKIEKELEDFESIASILKLTKYFSYHFDLKLFDYTQASTQKEPDKDLLKFEKYIHQLANLQYYLDQLKSIK